MTALKTFKQRPIIFGLAILLITLPFIASAIEVDELLRPEQAFQLTAKIEGNSLIAEYDIAPGYYMYRKRFKFDIETESANFANPIIPNGKLNKMNFLEKSKPIAIA